MARGGELRATCSLALLLTLPYVHSGLELMVNSSSQFSLYHLLPVKTVPFPKCGRNLGPTCSHPESCVGDPEHPTA